MAKRKSPVLQRQIVKPLVPFGFDITDQHVARAVPHDPNSCVIGQGIHSTPFGSKCQGFVVGATITKLITATQIICYKTPRALANALQKYDENHLWFLPAGHYELLPLSRSHRVKKVRHKRTLVSSKRTKPVRLTQPTRRTFRVGSKQLLVNFPI